MNGVLPICVAFMAAGCVAIEDTGQRRDVEVKKLPVTIDFQTGFTGEQVELSVDRKSIFSGVLTTDNRIGLARSIQHSPQRWPVLDLSVTVNESQSYSFRVNLERGRYLGFDRDLDDRIVRLSQERDPFVYD